MILFRVEKTNIAQENCMMLEVDGGFIYLSRDVYDQAVILNDRFESDYTIIQNKLGANDLQNAAIEYFGEVAPEPLNILAPYLGLVTDVELEQDIEELCGVLHQMATTINFCSFISVPKEVRANVSFTGNFIQKYKDSWNSIETKLIVTEVDIEAIKLDAIEALLERILPKVTGYVTQPAMGAPATTIQTQNITPMVSQTVQYTQPQIEPIPVTEVTAIDDSKEVDDPFAIFAEMIEPETPEQKREREARVAKSTEKTDAQSVTIDKIAGVNMKADMSQEKKDEVVKEAEGIKALMNKFGRCQ